MDRPLSKKGWRQAEGLLDLLRPFPVKRLLSSPYVRCVQTVEPAASALGLDIETRDELGEGASTAAALELARSLAGTTAVLCSHGDVVPALLFAFVEADGLALPEDPPCAKGSLWALDQEGGRVTSGRYLEPPT